MDIADLKLNNQDELVNNAKELYNSINGCIDKIVLSRLHQDGKAEERAVFQAETLLCQVQQYLSNIIDYLPIETKYKIGDKVWAKFGGEAILCKIDDILIVEDDGLLKVVYSISDLNERMFGTRFTNELVKYLEEKIMDVRLLHKYRRMAFKKFYLIEEVAVYPRCRYRWVHDKKELMPCYFLCDNGDKMWNEKSRCYQSSIDFDEAQRMLREQRTRYIEYLVANEKIKRCKKIKTKRV